MSAFTPSWARQVIDELDGVPVFGGYNDDALDPIRYGTPQAIYYEWRTLGEICIHTGDGDLYVYVPHGSDGEGMTLDVFSDLRELVSSGIIERLVELARQHAASPRLALPLPPRRRQ